MSPLNLRRMWKSSSWISQISSRKSRYIVGSRSITTSLKCKSSENNNDNGLKSKREESNSSISTITEKQMTDIINENDPETMDPESLHERLKYFESELIKSKLHGQKINTIEHPEATLPVSSNLNELNNPFNRYLKMLQRSRAALIEDTYTYDYMRNSVAARLADRLLDIKREFPRCMDLSGGFSALSKYIPKDKIKELIMVDISKEALYRDIINPDHKGIKYHQTTDEDSIEMEDSENTDLNSIVVENKPDFKISRIHGNEQTPHLLVEEGSVDAIFSSLNMHWMNDVQSFLQSVKRTLKPDGLFLAAMYSGDTLFELRTSLQLAELERHNALRPHVSPMAQTRDVASQLQNAGFNLITLDVDEFQIYYPNMIELMKDLRYMGENSAVGIEGSNVLNKDTLIAASSIYEQLYGLRASGSEDANEELKPIADEDEPGLEDTDVVIPATYQVTFLVGWRPHESQPKPLAPGSAKFSMKAISQAETLAYQEKRRHNNSENTEKSKHDIKGEKK